VKNNNDFIIPELAGNKKPLSGICTLLILSLIWLVTGPPTFRQATPTRVRKTTPIPSFLNWLTIGSLYQESARY
jgi:hypothetical protein